MVGSAVNNDFRNRSIEEFIIVQKKNYNNLTSKNVFFLFLTGKWEGRQKEPRVETLRFFETLQKKT